MIELIDVVKESDTTPSLYKIRITTKCVKINKNCSVRNIDSFVKENETYFGIVVFFRENAYLDIGVSTKYGHKIFVPIALSPCQKYMLNVTKIEHRGNKYDPK